MTDIIANIEQLTALRDAVRAEQARLATAGHKQIRLCMGAGCIASGAERVKAAIETELGRCGWKDRVSVVSTGCLGPCSAGPTMVVDEIFYENLKPQDGAAIVAEHIVKGRWSIA
jgi:NADH-quinone oxidoreductase subunit F